MKKVLFSMLILTASFITAGNVKAQQLKIGVFDLDVMVQAMPGYAAVDSMVQIYNNDSLSAEYDVYMNEYKRLDSTLKADSLANKPKTVMDYNNGKKREMGMQLAYWQQIAQQKSDTKRGQLAQPLYEKVAAAYKKVLDAKKYALVLKPQTYELGFPIDNIFISVAKELKLDSLPQQLLYLGDDPDAPKTAAPGAKPPVTGTKPKTN